jgi:hypothetical protein
MFAFARARLVLLLAVGTGAGGVYAQSSASVILDMLGTALFLVGWMANELEAPRTVWRHHRHPSRMR